MLYILDFENLSHSLRTAIFKQGKTKNFHRTSAIKDGAKILILPLLGLMVGKKGCFRSFLLGDNIITLPLNFPIFPDE